ncbi:MAG: flagellar hook-basal body complex protein FliE [Gammaproteobacteria bacterium]|nr:flagellar hook-basal body complex protein FliE [Gammaproteobacteria bacterium]
MIKAIDPNQLLTQMRAMQTQANQAMPMPAEQNLASGRVDFGDLMKNAVDKVNETQQTAGQLRTAFELGDPNVSLADVMIASQKSSVAFDATIQVRNKLIEAYQEVMRMSI